MRFRLTTIFYAMALIGAAIAAVGHYGIALALMVLLAWVGINSDWCERQRRAGLAVGLTILVFIMCLALYAGVLSPNLARGRYAYQMRVIGHALQTYHEWYGCFPPAYIADENGRPMHSWRVLILPFLEEPGLYNSYDFSEPWDGPSNRRLALTRPTPDIYCCTTDAENNRAAGLTTFVAIVGDNTMWPGTEGRSLGDVTDGAENTLLFVEAPDAAVPWTQPRDLTVDELVGRVDAEKRRSKRFAYHEEGPFIYTSGDWMVLFADNHRECFYEPPAADLLAAMATATGGEKIPRIIPTGEPRRYIRWGRVGSVVVFLLLTIAPLTRPPGQADGTRSGDSQGDRLACL